MLLAKLLPVRRVRILREILQCVGRTVSVPGSMRLLGCCRWHLMRGVSWNTNVFLGEHLGSPGTLLGAFVTLKMEKKRGGAVLMTVLKDSGYFCF